MESVFDNGGFISPVPVGAWYPPKVFTLPIFLVGSVSYNDPANVALSLPSGLHADDFVIIIGGYDGVGTSAPNSISLTAQGWTQVVSYGVANPGVMIWYKVMGLVPDTTVSFGGNKNGGYVIAAFRNVDITSPIDSSYQWSNTSVRVDSPAITVNNTGACVISMGVHNVDLFTPTAPTNYTLIGYAQHQSTTMMAYRVMSTTGSEDPGEFGGTTLTDTCRGYSLSLKPKSFTQYTINSGIWSMNRIKDSVQYYARPYYGNVFPNPYDIFYWIYNASPGTTCTFINDITTTSPFGGWGVLKMSVTGNDPHIQSYNLTAWNIAEAASGQKWQVRVWIKASVDTIAQVFLFGATSAGSIVDYTATTFNVTPRWREYIVERTFSDSTVRYIQMRLDGPDSGGTGQTLWFDGLQVIRIS